MWRTCSAFVVCALVGCGGPTVSGTWRSDGPTTDYWDEATFRDNGTAVIVGDNGRYQGRYHIEGSEMQLSFDLGGGQYQTSYVPFHVTPSSLALPACEPDGRTDGFVGRWWCRVSSESWQGTRVVQTFYTSMVFDIEPGGTATVTLGDQAPMISSWTAAGNDRIRVANVNLALVDGVLAMSRLKRR